METKVFIDEVRETCELLEKIHAHKTGGFRCPKCNCKLHKIGMFGGLLCKHCRKVFPMNLRLKISGVSNV